MKINYYKLTESEMNDIPFSAGSLYRTTDTDKMYLDPIGGTERILLEVESVNSLDTSDATATADDIRSGATAYVNGEKITGNIRTAHGGFNSVVTPQKVSYGMPAIELRCDISEPVYISPNTGGTIKLTAMYSEFGDAEAADVAEGKTFTAAAGFKVTGTGYFYDNEDSIVSRTLSAYTNSRVSNIGQGAFAYAQSLTSVDFPNVTYIGGSAFAYCSSLTTVSFPVCTDIGSSAFEYCRSLTTASFPICTTINYRAFAYCSSLTTVSFPACSFINGHAFSNCIRLTTASFPVCTDIGSYAFYYCTGLTTASFPACTSINFSAFVYCTSLTAISLPVCTNINTCAFQSCYKLTTASLPVCTYIGGSVFAYCSSLTTVSFPVCTSIIGSYTFRGCRTLSSLTLGCSTVCTLSNSNAFTSTPYAGYSAYFSGTPAIYVPASLIANYQTATNWTYFSSYFKAIDA